MVDSMDITTEGKFIVYNEIFDFVFSQVLRVAHMQFSMQWTIVMDTLNAFTFLFHTTERDLGNVDSCIFSLCCLYCLFVIHFSFYLPETLEPDHDVHLDICWQRLEGDNMCSKPSGRRTTYTECCCLFGIAWSGQCAFCPRKDSGEKQDAHTTAITLFNDSCLYINTSLLLLSKIQLYPVCCCI